MVKKILKDEGLALQPGEKFSDYYVLGKMGHGKMAEIFKGLQVINDEGDTDRFVKELLKTTVVEQKRASLERKLENWRADEHEFKIEITTAQEKELPALNEELRKEKPVHNDYEIRRIASEVGIKSDCRLVAIKFLSYDAIQFSNNKLELFNMEKALLSSLKHQNLPIIYGQLSNERGIGYVMDFVDGNNLKHILKDGKRQAIDDGLQGLKPEIVFSVGYQLALGLDYQSKVGIVHSDIKPDNIMLTYDDGFIKLVDFGMALSFDPTSKELPQTNMKGGSVPFFSPQIMECIDFTYVPNSDREKMEFIKPIKVDPLNDIWALGVALYELGAGSDRRPFISPHRRESELKKIIMNENPDTIIKENNKFTSQEYNVILKCLERNPQKRYQTGSELALDIGKCLNKRGINMSNIHEKLHEFMTYAREKRKDFYTESQTLTGDITSTVID